MPRIQVTANQLEELAWLHLSQIEFGATTAHLVLDGTEYWCEIPAEVCS